MRVGTSNKASFSPCFKVCGQMCQAHGLPSLVQHEQLSVSHGATMCLAQTEGRPPCREQGVLLQKGVVLFSLP